MVSLQSSSIHAAYREMVRTMTARQINTFSYYVKRGCLLLIFPILLFPSSAVAEPSFLLSIMEELESLDLKELKDLKLSAKLKTDKKGKMEFRCLNFSVPVAANPFERMGGWIKLNHIEVKALKNGAVAKAVFSF